MYKSIYSTLNSFRARGVSFGSGSIIQTPTPGTHIPALDGLRGLAIILVMLHHFSLYGDIKPTLDIDKLITKITYAGWFGVDLFFVLSGFLITGILLDTKESKSYFRNFYMRRILRIFPLYYSVLIIFFLVIPKIAVISPEYQSLLNNQAWYWSYLANVLIGLNGWSAYYGIDHFWSLAVEEQFYLFWPLVVYFCQRRTLLKLCIVIIVISLITRIGLGMVDYRLAAYVLTPARMDALAVGAFIALAIRGSSLDRLNLFRWAWPMAGICGLAILAIFIRKQSLEPGNASVYTAGFSLLALFFGAILIISLTCSPGALLGKFLGSPSMRFFGKYSYALYVFHHFIAIYLPLYGFSIQTFPTVMGSQLPGLFLFSLVATVISLGLALLSWVLLESRFLALKRFFNYESNRSDTAFTEFEVVKG